MNQLVPDVGVHHVAVHTTDYQGTVEFYTSLLGMTVSRSWQAADGRQLALLDIGCGAFIEVIAFPAETPQPAGGQQHPWMHLALATSDPDTVWQRAIDAGFPSVIDPKDVSLGGLSARIAFFSGPNGEVIELFSTRG
ncbi:MAG: VOC family protein [Armatimonadetes bacterium]|nr:VOC family protein [Armatimonadota bacterium]